MRAQVNDWLRIVIARCVRIAGVAFSVWQQFRLRGFRFEQERLKRKYRRKVNFSTDGRFAATSGSAGDPKRILYTNERLRGVKIVFSDMFARACWAFRIKRTSLYVFSSFDPDNSLTSMLLDEVDLPNYLATLQAPYRVQRHPAMRALAAEYGATAVRLWIIAIANPGVFYSTNPSTITTFFDDLSNHWRESARLIENWCKDRKRFNSDIRKIARRLDSEGSEQRLLAIATTNEPVTIDVWAPTVEAYICWTGGYVKPFLDQLQKHLPSPRYRLIPMYSMSTETLETLSHFQNGDVFFLPMAPGVVYEFLTDTDEEQLPGLTEVEPGKLYEMVVSDAYGLRRYRTNDLFLCRRRIDGLPDLVFVRRRGLEYSFTGEKLTAEQVSIVFEQLRRQYPDVFANRYLTCVPFQSPKAMPHYKVLLVGERSANVELESLAARCDELFSEVNCEYRTKRASGRLGAVAFAETGTREFAEQISSHSGWESQFKFLPLCPHLISHDPEHVS